MVELWLAGEPFKLLPQAFGRGKFECWDHEDMPLPQYTESPRYLRLHEADNAEEIGWELFHYYLDVASGRKKTWTEAHRIHNDLALFNPAPLT